MSHPFRILLQYLLPHHGVSRVVHRAARSRRIPLRRALMRWFIRRYGVDMAEALEPEVDSYPDFNSFFTRALRPGVRPILAGEDQVCCPVDGFVSQVGTIDGTEIFQAKGHRYSLTQLLGGSQERAQPFLGGAFATLYLSPGNYHRVHMPLSGRLVEMVHIPGRLFSVSPPCVEAIPGLFARNERVASIFTTEAGPMAVVLVGAINVGSIETAWADEVTPPRGRLIATNTYPPDGGRAVSLAKGEEMGRFNLGSTVILLFQRGQVAWEGVLRDNAKVRLGQTLGRILVGNSG